VDDHKFQFTLNLTDPAYRDVMLGELASSVLGHVGFQDNALASILGHLRSVIAEAIGTGCRDCTVQFHVEHGQLEIVVLHDGCEWRTTKPLP
jgi:hypothetical protein